MPFCTVEQIAGQTADIQARSYRSRGTNVVSCKIEQSYVVKAEWRYTGIGPSQSVRGKICPPCNPLGILAVSLTGPFASVLFPALEMKNKMNKTP